MQRENGDDAVCVCGVKMWSVVCVAWGSACAALTIGMVHAALGQNVTFGRYGVPACPWAIFEPGNRSRRVKLVSDKSPLVLWEG